MPAPDAREHPTIQVRRRWTDPWVAEPELRVSGPVDLRLGSAGAGTLKLLRKYGPKVKYATASSYQTDATPAAYLDYWVRLLKAGTQTVLWQGLIKDDQREIYRSAGNQRGVQILVAWGPGEIARRCTVRSAYWAGTDTPIQELGWVPGMNYRGPAGELEGNRGAQIALRSYIYGLDPGTLWSHADYLDYLAAWHLQQYSDLGGPIGPRWTVSGQTGALDGIVTMMRWGPAQNVLSMIRRLVNPAWGFDFAFLPTALGFEVKIFTLTKTPSTFAAVTLPANPDQFTVNPTTEDGVIAASAEISARERVDRVEVVGERIVSCFTVDAAVKRSLWSAAQEAAYKAGTGTPGDAAELHDRARCDDRHALVYQAFAAPVAWDWDYGYAAPVLNALGQVAGLGADRQTEFRNTLPLMPLKKGGDYTTAPPDLADAVDEYVPPLALVQISADMGWAPADALAGMDQTEAGLAAKVGAASIIALAREWGLIVDFDHNHALAKNHWSSDSPADSELDPETEGMDYDTMDLTLAAKTDQRLRCYKDETQPENDGSKRVIEVPGARLEWLTRSTVIGASVDGTGSYSPATGVILRNDNQKLHQIMAGAIERYLKNRFRVVIIWNEIKPWVARLGQILVMGPSEGDLQQEWALVTSVSFDFERGTTTLKAGYAR